MCPIAAMLFAVCASAAFERDTACWACLGSWSARDWALLVGCSFWSYVAANLMQQLSIRHIGAPLGSTFMGTRLLSAVGGGYLLLGERVASWVEVAGLAVVCATVSAYLVRQYLLSRRMAVVAKMASAEAEVELGAQTRPTRGVGKAGATATSDEEEGEMVRLLEDGKATTPSREIGNGLVRRASAEGAQPTLGRGRGSGDS